MFSYYAEPNLGILCCPGVVRTSGAASGIYRQAVDRIDTQTPRWQGSQAWLELLSIHEDSSRHYHLRLDFHKFHSTKTPGKASQRYLYIVTQAWTITAAAVCDPVEFVTTSPNRMVRLKAALPLIYLGRNRSKHVRRVTRRPPS